MRGGDVGVVAVDDAGEFLEVETRGIAGRQFQPRPPAEDDQAGLVALVAAAALLHRLVDEALLAQASAGPRSDPRSRAPAGCSASGRQEQDRDRIVLVLDAKLGQGQRNQGDEQAAQAERHPAADRTQAPPGCGS